MIICLTHIPTGLTSRRVTVALLIGLACLQSTAATPKKPSTTLPGPDYELLFEDNFDSAEPDETKWLYRLGERTGLNIDGLNKRSSVSQRNGLLVIENKVTAIDGKVRNIGGGLISKKLFGYGYYEVRAKPFLGGRGVHSAFWQRGESDISAGYSNTIFEIDGFEIDSPRLHSTNNLYVIPNSLGRKESPWPHRGNRPVEVDKNGWLYDAYDYAPTGITFYDNGKAVGHASFPMDFPDLVAQQNVWLTALNGVGSVDRDKPGETFFDYFRFYARDYPGYNILPNGTFEYNRTQVSLQIPVAWRESGDVAASFVKQVDDPHTGKYVLHHGARKSFSVTTKQSLENIRNGQYDVAAWTRTSAGFNGSKLRVQSGPNSVVLPIPPASTWTLLKMSGFQLTNNGATLSIESNGNAGEWVEVDDITVMKPRTGPTLPDVAAYNPAVDPVWRLFEERPMPFTGDDTFYFFDRNLGLGDAMTATVVVNAAKLQETLPIMRAGRTGKDGWAIGLGAQGKVYCLIGSTGDHIKVSASNGYRAGEPVMLTCVNDKGNVTLYVNGIEAAKTYTSEYGTRDEKAAGRLGATGAWYDAVGDVTGSATPATNSDSRNFIGSLYGVSIYNRAMSAREIKAVANSLK